MAHTLKKKNPKSRISFAIIADVAVQKRVSDAEAKKLMKWLHDHIEVDDAAYDIVPVELHWQHSRVAERSSPIKFRVVEYFN